MDSELSTGNDGDGGASRFKLKMDGTEPVTDYDSQTVMLAAERNDNIEITDVVERFYDKEIVPDQVTVIKRSDSYHGPELLVNAEIDGNDQNYLITAPGPHSHLYLWVGEGPTEKKRNEWIATAEVNAALAVEQPPYETCSQCGELIRTVEHEREAVLGNCSRVKTLTQ